ncbi:MAG TPA: hypothetical protein VMM13_14425, partial [Euzebya sp.]|nr:hypothetical protein [Euzebya sp.]
MGSADDLTPVDTFGAGNPQLATVPGVSQMPYHPSLTSDDAVLADPNAGRGPQRSPVLVLAVVLLIIALAAVSTVAVVQTARLGDLRAEVTRLQAQAGEDARRIEQLGLELEAAQSAPPPAPSPDPLGEGGLEELFGEGGLEDLLGEGGLEDLLGEGGLEGLFGEGGLEDLLDQGATAAPDVAACTTDVANLPDIDEETLQGQFQATTEVVEQLRGQTFPQPITPEVMTAEEIREFFRAEIAEAYPPEQAETERRALSLLQAVPDDIDLVQTQIDLLGDQVAGFYDDETGQLVVRADDPDAVLTGAGLITLAHELEHALVDATVGLPALDDFDTDDDGAIAALSVVEGSAVALQSQFQVSALDPLALFGDLGSLLEGQQGLDRVPSLIRQSLLFPYIAGPTYVCGLYADGGWDAVDQAVQAPPATTHQIMFPGDGVDAPAAVPEPSGPDGMDLVERRSFGAAQLSWLFAAPGGDEAQALPDAVGSVRPWRGGQLSLWTQGDDSAIALVLSGEGLCRPVTSWWQAAAAGSRDAPEGIEEV